MPTLVLVHSPLVGPLVWQPVAEALRRRGQRAVVPALAEAVEAPYWPRHVTSVVRAVAGAKAPLLLVGHSGAGVLLPAIGAAVARPVVGYLFVDADLPRDGASRLALFGSDQERAGFRAAADEAGRLPTWSEEDLAEAIPDATLRRRFVEELRPLPLAVYEEPLPVPAGWPDAPCGYLHLSASYDAAAREAQARGWPHTRLAGGHFHPLNAPDEVAVALLDLAAQMGVAGVREA